MGNKAVFDERREGNYNYELAEGSSEPTCKSYTCLKPVWLVRNDGRGVRTRDFSSR